MTGHLLGPDQTGRWVHVVDDRIVQIGTGPVPDLDAVKLDATDATIEPGRVNAHTHLYSGLAPLGMPPPETAPDRFVQILERVWWILDRALDEASLRASARYYVAHALLSGTTTLIDHHESPPFIEGSLSVLAEVCEDLGMRAALTYGATERNFGEDEARRGLEECRRFHEASRGSTTLRAFVGLHASFTVSDATVNAAGRMARALGIPLHVHLAEDHADVVDAQNRGYPGPLERLDALGALVPNSLLAHGVHLSEAAVTRAVEAGGWLVQNPRSNANNRVGYPVHLGQSSKVALGTDGFDADMRAEQAALREHAKTHGEPAAVVQARFDAGRDLVSSLFGQPIGPLAPGAIADLAVMKGAQARHVLVGGRLVVQDGALTTSDADEIADHAQREAHGLWTRMTALRKAAS